MLTDQQRELIGKWMADPSTLTGINRGRLYAWREFAEGADLAAIDSLLRPERADTGARPRDDGMERGRERARREFPPPPENPYERFGVR